MPAEATFHIVLNAGSGASDVQQTRDTIAEQLGRAGRRHEILTVEREGPTVAALAALAVARARREGGGVVVAAGGDGTLNAVAQAVLGSGCLFGVLPLGTFNYFGRTHGLPLDVVEATRNLCEGEAQPVQVGRVADRVFLVNASIGLYPQLLEDREAYKQRFGRHRLVALWSGLVTLLNSHRQLRLTVDYEGRSRELRTLTLFVGNSRLQLEQVGLPQAPLVEQGRLAAVMLRPMGAWGLLGLLLRGALRQLDDADGIESFSFERLSLRPRLPLAVRRFKLAADGEVFWHRGPVTFSVAEEPLMLIKPRAAAQAADPGLHSGAASASRSAA